MKTLAALLLAISICCAEDGTPLVSAYMADQWEQFQFKWNDKRYQILHSCSTDDFKRLNAAFEVSADSFVDLSYKNVIDVKNSGKTLNRDTLSYRFYKYDALFADSIPTQSPNPSAACTTFTTVVGDTVMIGRIHKKFEQVQSQLIKIIPTSSISRNTGVTLKPQTGDRVDALGRTGRKTPSLLLLESIR